MIFKKRTYLDYAAATPMCRAAQRAYTRTLQHVGNPGAIHREGVQAHEILEHARARIAQFFNCKPERIVFTAGGTESNNIAILGHARALENTGIALSDTHWIVSSIEHPSVLACFHEVERRGGQVSYLPPDAHGRIRTDDLQQALTPQTVFVSIGWANGETGTLQNIRDCTQVVDAYTQAYGVSIIFHTDAGQAPLYLPTTIHSLGVHLLTLDSGKCYGPKGIGIIYQHRDAALAPLMFGGGQERGLRPGSETPALAAGFAAALTWVARIRNKEHQRLEKLRTYCIEKLEEMGATVNGHYEYTLPHIINISFESINGEYVTLALDHRGIALSTKSSCREGEAGQSHVVAALGGPAWRAHNTLRISLGHETRKRDIRTLIFLLADTLDIKRKN